MTEQEELELAEAEAEANANAQQAPKPAAQPAPVAPQEPAYLSPQSKTGAALRGFGQGASYGFGDELAGVAAVPTALGLKAIDAARTTTPGRWLARQMIGPKADLMPDSVIDAITSNAVGESRAAGGLKEGVADTYSAARNDVRRENAQAQAAQPYVYGASEIAGNIAAPGPKFAGGARVPGGMLTKAGARALTGTTQGALYSAGASNADTIGGTVADTALGGGVGGVLGVGFGAAGDKLSGWLRKRSEENALKALGLRAGISSQLEKRGYETADEARQLGKEALDMGLIRPGRTAEDVAREAAIAKEGYGAMIESALAEGDTKGAMDLQRASWDAAGNVMGPNGLNATQIRQGGSARRLVGDIAAQADIDPSFRAANELKSSMYEGINFGNDPALKTKMERKAVQGLRNSIESQLREVAGDEAADTLATANQRYGPLVDIHSLAREEANRQLERKGGSGLSGLIAGSAGLTAAGPAGIAAAPALSLWQSQVTPRLPSLAANAQRWATPAPSKLAPWLTREATHKATSPDDKDEAAIMSFIKGNGG